MRASLVMILFAASCSKGPPAIDPNPKNVESPDQNPPPPPPVDAAPAKPEPPAASDPLFFAPRDIKPPPTRNVAPVKTTEPVVTAKLNTISSMDVPDWVHEPAGVVDHVAVLHYRTVTRPKVTVEMIIQPCVILQQNKCIPMDLAKWQAPENVDALDEAFPANLRKAAAKSETGIVPVGGAAQAIFEYHLVVTTSTDIRGRSRLVGDHSYTLFYNDGINKIRVTAMYNDEPPKDADALAATITRDQLVATARGFFELFTTSWQ